MRTFNGKVYEEKAPHDFDELVEIVDALRSENGCKWDRVQTHETLKKCLMDESEEVLEAVRIISGFIESGGIRYFEPEMYNLSFTMYGEGESLIDKLKGGDETAIKAVKATKADDAIYNLNGQRVNASYKGLVIKNGKKVVIK